MRRLMFAAGLLASVAVAEADAGYLIVRVIVEGGGGAGADPTGSGTDFGGMPPGGEGSAPYPAPMFGPGGAPMAGPAGHDPTRSVFAVVPFTKVPDPKGRPFYPKSGPHAYINPIWKLALDHPFGSTNVFFDNTQIQLYTDFVQTPAASKTRQSEILARHAQWLKNPADGQQLLDILTDALEHGMPADAAKFAEDLYTAVEGKKARTTPQVDRFQQAYGKIRDGLRGRLNHPGDAPEWVGRFGLLFPRAAERSSAHYSLITWDTDAEEARRRLDQLEDNFKGFYLWHATRGVALPLPDHRLVAALASTGQEFRKLADGIDGLPRFADACYAPDHDLLLLSPRRLDAVGLTFDAQMNEIYRKGATRDQLLGREKKGPLINTVAGQPGVPPEAKKPEEVARWMTWAMVERYAREDTEIAAVSREGSRQLFYATGRLPRHVALPQWLSNGAAAFFHRPRGPVYTPKGDDKTVATLALTTGYGVPNYAMQKVFRDLSDRKHLNADPGMLLRNVVTDAYFAAALTGVDADDPKLPPPLKKKPPTAVTGAAPGTPGAPMPEGGSPMGVGGIPPQPPAEDPAAYARRKREFLVNKAHATSWALFFHLAQNDPAGLDRYRAELDKLPRDLPLEPSVRLGVFARAFGLVNDTTGAEDRARFAGFAARWLDALAKTPSVGVDVELLPPAPPMPTTSPEGMNPLGPLGSPPGGP